MYNVAFESRLSLEDELEKISQESQRSSYDYEIDPSSVYSSSGGESLAARAWNALKNRVSDWFDLESEIQKNSRRSLTSINSEGDNTNLSLQGTDPSSLENSEENSESQDPNDPQNNFSDTSAEGNDPNNPRNLASVDEDGNSSNSDNSNNRIPVGSPDGSEDGRFGDSSSSDSPYYDPADYEYYDGDYNGPSYNGGFADSSSPDSNFQSSPSSDFSSAPRGDGGSFVDSNGNQFDTGGNGSGSSGNSTGSGDDIFVGGGGGAFFPPGFGNDNSSGENANGSSSSDSANNGGGSPTDTLNFSNIGSSQDASAGSVAPNCSPSRAPGTYITSIDVSLSCNQASNILYCVGPGDGTCCDPTQSGTEYTGSINIGQVDGDYCVSFIGRSNTNLLYSQIVNTIYDIDSALPVIESIVPRRQVQSTQLPFTMTAISSDYGRVNHYLSHINTKNENPANYSWSCNDIMNNYTSMPDSMAILDQYQVDNMNPEQVVMMDITSNEIDYGNNYVSTILEDRRRGLTGCQTQNIVLQDFPTFAFTSTSPSNPAMAQSHFGGFVSFGHFQVTPNSASSGSGESQKEEHVLQESFLAITH